MSLIQREKEYQLQIVDKHTKHIITAYIFSLNKNKKFIISKIIINEIICYYFEVSTMDACTKWYRVWDNFRTANSLPGIYDTFKEQAIRCSNWVYPERHHWVHEWLFRIDYIPDEPIANTYFRLFVKNKDRMINLRWHPSQQLEHKIKDFQTHDMVILSITFRGSEKFARLRVNEWYDGPQYELYNEDYTVGWATKYANVQITLINYRKHYPQWFNETEL